MTGANREDGVVYDDAPAEQLPAADAERPEKKRPVYIPQMAQACIDEALRIRAAQQARVAAELIKEPMPSQMLLADVFEATAKFLDLIEPVQDQVKDAIRAHQRAQKRKK